MIAAVTAWLARWWVWIAIAACAAALALGRLLRAIASGRWKPAAGPANPPPPMHEPKAPSLVPLEQQRANIHAATTAAATTAATTTGHIMEAHGEIDKDVDGSGVNNVLYGRHTNGTGG